MEHPRCIVRGYFASAAWCLTRFRAIIIWLLEALLNCLLRVPSKRTVTSKYSPGCEKQVQSEPSLLPLGHSTITLPWTALPVCLFSITWVPYCNLLLFLMPICWNRVATGNSCFCGNCLSPTLGIMLSQTPTIRTLVDCQSWLPLSDQHMWKEARIPRQAILPNSQHFFLSCVPSCQLKLTAFTHLVQGNTMLKLHSKWRTSLFFIF